MITNNKGQVIALLPFILFLMLGICVIVIDGGILINTKQHLQDAVDLSALSGAIEYTKTQSKSHMVQKAKDIGVGNGLKNGNISVSSNFESNPYTITVTASDDANFFFAQIFGIDKTKVTASGTVRFAIGEQMEYLFYSIKGNRLFETGDENIIDGKLYAEEDAEFDGKRNVFNSDVELLRKLKKGEKENTFNALLKCSDVIKCPDGQADQITLIAVDIGTLKQEAISQGNYHIGDLAISRYSTFNLNGIYYVEGKLKLDDNKISGNGIFITTDDIEVRHSLEYLSTDDSFVFYSERNIHIKEGHLNKFDGVFYAMNGLLQFDQDDNFYYGRYYTNELRINGKRNHFTLDTRPDEIFGQGGGKLILHLSQ